MKDEHSSPLPLAGGAGGGHFLPRDTTRARELRNQPSPAERRLWRALNRGQINGFRFNRQMPIGPYFADFLCRAARLVIEIDGWSHGARQEYDRQRDRFMAAEGFAVVRFTNADLMTNLDGVVQQIAIALGKRCGEAGEENCPPPAPPAGGRGVGSAAQKLVKIDSSSPLPLAGGAGGGHFLSPQVSPESP